MEWWTQAVPQGSYEKELDYMLDFFKRRVVWLDGEIRGDCHHNPK